MGGSSRVLQDIDTSDPAELVKKSWVASESKPQRKHKFLGQNHLEVNFLVV